MDLYRIGYHSKVRGTLHKSDIRRILRASSENNRANGLTGALLFNQREFLQILEGRRPIINNTYRRILADKHHEDMELVGMEPITTRVFHKWSMAFIEDTPATLKILLKYCGADRAIIDNLTLSTMTDMMQLMLKDDQEAN